MEDDVAGNAGEEAQRLVEQKAAAIAAMRQAADGGPPRLRPHLDDPFKPLLAQHHTMMDQLEILRGDIAEFAKFLDEHTKDFVAKLSRKLGK
jgi:hypothetical protein